MSSEDMRAAFEAWVELKSGDVAVQWNEHGNPYVPIEGKGRAWFTGEWQGFQAAHAHAEQLIELADNARRAAEVRQAFIERAWETTEQRIAALERVVEAARALLTGNPCLAKYERPAGEITNIRWNDKVAALEDALAALESHKDPSGPDASGAVAAGRGGGSLDDVASPKPQPGKPGGGSTPSDADREAARALASRLLRPDEMGEVKAYPIQISAFEFVEFLADAISTARDEEREACFALAVSASAVAGAPKKGERNDYADGYRHACRHIQNQIRTRRESR